MTRSRSYGTTPPPPPRQTSYEIDRTLLEQRVAALEMKWRIGVAVAYVSTAAQIGFAIWTILTK